jgi:hypothetical protein
MIAFLYRILFVPELSPEMEHVIPVRNVMPEVVPMQGSVPMVLVFVA